MSMNNRSQLLNNARKFQKEYDSGSMGLELAEVCRKVLGFFEYGYLTYSSYDRWDSDIRAPRWFYEALTLEQGDRAMVSYLPKEDAAKPRSQTIGKFLSFATSKMGLVLDDKQVAMYGEWAGKNFKASSFTYEIVRGNDIIAEYRNHYFGSCMAKSPGVMFYAANPDVCEQVLVSMDGRRVGRALLWTTTSGNKFLERIYPSDNGPQVDFLMELARESGWDYKTRQTYGDSTAKSTHHVVRMRDVGAYPYLDTLHYGFGHAVDGVDYIDISNRPFSRNTVALQSTGNHSPFSSNRGMLCPYYGQRFDQSEFQYVPSLKTYVSSRARNELFVVDRNGNYELRDDMVESRTLRKFVSQADSVQLTSGSASGDWVPRDYPFVINVGGETALRADAVYTTSGWRYPDPANILAPAPALTYQGVTVGDVIHMPVAPGRPGSIVRVDTLWYNDDPNSIRVRNVRNNNSIDLQIKDLTPDYRFATNAEVEAYCDVLALGDIVMLREAFDGTATWGGTYEAGTLGFVQLFDETSGYSYVFVRPAGKSTPYFHALSSNQVRRLARRGSVISVPSNATGFAGDSITITDVRSYQEIIIDDGGTARTISVNELFDSGIFGTAETVEVNA